MNEQDKIQGKQLIDVKVDNLSEKEFKIMIVQISEGGGLEMEAGIEKMQGMFNKDLEELKNRDKQYYIFTE